MSTLKKQIKIRVFSAYSNARKAWYVTKEIMTEKEFNKYVKDQKVQEFKYQDSWKISKDETYSWKKGYICKLSD